MQFLPWKGILRWGVDEALPTGVLRTLWQKEAYCDAKAGILHKKRCPFANEKSTFCGSFVII